MYQVGATKEGVPFAGGDGKPECVVSGGLGTMPVMYKGKTYYVCCSGCRDAFKMSRRSTSRNSRPGRTMSDLRSD